MTLMEALEAEGLLGREGLLLAVTMGQWWQEGSRMLSLKAHGGGH
jgi:hypothetical protein